jgi:glycosyltransferase involved in cell wall biosynthesis
MACGAALVSTDNGGVRAYADDGKTALLSPPKDPVKLADNALKLLRNNNLRIHIAQRGHDHIQQFTWDRATDALEEVLKARRISGI